MIRLEDVADESRWTGRGVRRDVLFFAAAGQRLFGSLFVVEPSRRARGLVFIPSWGFEADRPATFVYGLARSLAEHGSGAFLFHYPGTGDSSGSLAELDSEDLVEAAAAAVAQARTLRPEMDWIPTGFSFGAAVAACAAERIASADLLLLEPALDPVAYFSTLRARASRGRLGKEPADDGSIFGHPVPAALEHPGFASAVSIALEGYEGRVTSISHRWHDHRRLLDRWWLKREAAPIDERFDARIVEDRWRLGQRDYPALRQAALEWTIEQER